MLISNHAISAVSRLYAGSASAGARRVDALRANAQVGSYAPASSDIASKMLAMRY